MTDNFRLIPSLVPDPCYSLRIELYNQTGPSYSQSGDVYVGKWPVVKPALSQTPSGSATFAPGNPWAPMLTWTSYDWGGQVMLLFP